MAIYMVALCTIMGTNAEGGDETFPARDDAKKVDGVFDAAGMSQAVIGRLRGMSAVRDASDEEIEAVEARTRDTEPGLAEQQRLIDEIAEQHRQQAAAEEQARLDAEAAAKDAEPELPLDQEVEPATEEAPAEPVAEEAPAEPVAEEAPAEPVAEEAPAEPVAEEAPAEPVAEEAPAEPVAEEAPAEPATEEAAAAKTVAKSSRKKATAAELLDGE